MSFSLQKILVTGGAGFIGSHVCVELLELGYEITVLDNFSNSTKAVLRRIEKICGTTPHLIEGDVLDSIFLEQIFNENRFDAVIHFAGLKAVGESVDYPLRYYLNNVQGTLSLLNAMSKHNCYRLVFSSSATVYGDPAIVPITESSALCATNPYGRSKLMIEDILRDLSKSDVQWQISILRYFNPVAAHPSGLIGEHPNGIPNNLMPFIGQVATGKLERLAIFGDDYQTKDGTGVRDYIHVVDLARAHVLALQKPASNLGCNAYNIGTGIGYSVFEMIKAFENASGQDIPYSIKPRREGDIAQCYADPSLSFKDLGWQAEFGLEQMMCDQWNWQCNNPNGYR